MPLADLVIWLANRKLTGVLSVELGTLRKEFTLDGGAVIRGASNEPREYFAQFLMHFGVSDAMRIQKAQAAQYENKVRVGKVLVMMGAVPEEQVVQILQIKVSETLLDAFRWTAGRYVFVDQRPRETLAEIPIAVPLVTIHREGIARSGVWEQYGRIFPNPMHILYVDEARVPVEMDPSSIDGHIIELARQNMMIEQMAYELHATDYQVAVRLLDLHQRGMIYAREPSYALPIPRSGSDTGRSYVDLARTALDRDDYTEALRHVEKGARQNPDDRTFSELRREVETRAKEKMETTMASSAVPTPLREMTKEEKKRLTAKERYVFARIDGQRSVDAIIQVSPMLDIETMEILRKFEVYGVIRMSRPA